MYPPLKGAPHSYIRVIYVTFLMKKGYKGLGPQFSSLSAADSMSCTFSTQLLWFQSLKNFREKNNNEVKLSCAPKKPVHLNSL